MTLRPSNTRAAKLMIKFSVAALIVYIVTLCKLPILVVAVIFFIQSKTILGCVFAGIYILLRVSSKLLKKSLKKQSEEMVLSPDFIKVE